MSQSSSYSTNTDGIPLAACAKCNNRHPHEELSQSHQLCKSCRGSHHMVKCNYCRTEYHQESSSNVNGRHNNPICSKCLSLEAQHGKPGPCAYCNIIAAFIGTRCQRCTNSEKKYGSPLACEHCKQKCAFDREDPESKKKVDNKLLCWLCTMAYKRTLAKARQKEAAKMMASSGQHRSSTADNRASSSGRHHSNHHQNSMARHQSSSGPNETSQRSMANNHRHSSHQHVGSNRQHDSLSSVSFKKQRTENASNGIQSSMPAISSISDGRFIEPSVPNDMTAVVAQLKEQVSLLNKRVQMKEKELLSKDQQIAELRATITREQRETREKVSTIQKQHSERMSELQDKIIAMQKQIVAHSKAGRSSSATTLVEPPMVI